MAAIRSPQSASPVRLAGVLPLHVIQNVINQIGTLSSHYRSVVSGAFLAVVAVQAYLSRACLRGRR